MRQAAEPSVEEILESIKKVIARDNRAVPAAETAHLDAAEAADEDDDEVLDLGTVGEVTAHDEDSPAESPLLDSHTTVSMRESLAALAMLSEPGVPPQIVRSGETSLEGLTRELLRPALAEWLEKNLPPLVERMVAAEIARIVGKKV